MSSAALARVQQRMQALQCDLGPLSVSRAVDSMDCALEAGEQATLVSVRGVVGEVRVYAGDECGPPGSLSQTLAVGWESLLPAPADLLRRWKHARPASIKLRVRLEDAAVIDAGEAGRPTWDGGQAGLDLYIPSSHAVPPLGLSAGAVLTARRVQLRRLATGKVRRRHPRVGFACVPRCLASALGDVGAVAVANARDAGAQDRRRQPDAARGARRVRLATLYFEKYAGDRTAPARVRAACARCMHHPARPEGAHGLEVPGVPRRRSPRDVCRYGPRAVAPRPRAAAP